MEDTPNTASRAIPAREDYTRRLELAKQEIQQLQATQLRMVWIRTFLFLSSLACLVLAYLGDVYPLVLGTLGWLSTAAFLLAIVRHEALRLAVLSHQSDAALLRHLLGRLDRKWEDVPAQRLLPEFSGLAYADDLDIGGDASLLSLLSLAVTYPGSRMLQQWISTPTTWEDVLPRQRAVQCIVPERELRLSILKTIRASCTQSHSVYGLADWSRQPSWLARHPVASVVSYLGPALVILGVVLGLILKSTENPWLINSAAVVAGVGLLINILATVFWGSWIHDIFLQVTGEHRSVYQFASVFTSLARLPSDAGLLDRIRRVAAEEPNCAAKGFSKLMTVVRLANLQRDVILYMLYLALQLLFLWDFRVLRLLERWRTEFGEQVTAWFDALGEFEAILSGACLADENPAWCFPQPQLAGNQSDSRSPETRLSDSRSPDSRSSDSRSSDAHSSDSQVAQPQACEALRIDASALGHPLIADQARVPNDFHLDDSRPLLLVTGSNMAGKSTFMRAVGLNLVLARTGSPVCAERLSTPLFELASSIRVRDDLHSGVSFFMAELHRLKEVVDTAQERSQRASEGQSPPPILFLLDEILQGTNSRERQIAVVTVLEKLLNSGAIGLVSTHDLDLATADEIESVSQVVHFREYFETDSQGQEVMRFDYCMYPGPTPTTNALKLLQLVGLDTQDVTS